MNGNVGKGLWGVLDLWMVLCSGYRKHTYQLSDRFSRMLVIVFLMRI